MIVLGGYSTVVHADMRCQDTGFAAHLFAAAQPRAAALYAAAQQQPGETEPGAQFKTKSQREEFERIYPSRYKVKKGETMADIAGRREIFNDTYMWPLIYKANRDQIRDPNIVYPGQELTIPRDIKLEDIIEARKQADAPSPYTPPRNAYTPEVYRKYLSNGKDSKQIPEDNDSKQ